MAEAEGTQGGKPPKDMKKIFAMAYMALNLAAMGVGSYLVYASTLGYKPLSASSEELNREITAFRQTLLEKPMTYTMETFNTNLTGLPRRLIRLEVNLEMLDAEGFEEIINLGARGRDSIVRIINNKTYDDLESVQGKLHLKNEIIAQLNSQLERGVVKNIFFSDFVVQ
ncbi:MAG: flagellar basal body-associated protein FliL [Bdellovibrionales bacterium]